MLLLLLTACSATVSPPDPCQSERPVEGEVRARRIICSDELIEGAEARVGDWMLENSRIRIAIRDATNSLTQLVGTGGTIIDLAVDDGRDGLTEIVPQVGNEWLEEATITASTDSNKASVLISGVTFDGQESNVEYRLEADQPQFIIDGADQWLAVPRIGTEHVGNALEVLFSDQTVLLAADGPIEDLGGWLTWSDPHQMLAGTRSDVHERMWPDGRWIEGTSDGEWIRIETVDEVIGRLPIADGVFSGWVPPTATLISIADGHADGIATEAAEGLDLPVGPGGFLELMVIDQDGEPIPAHLTSNRGEFDLVQELNTVPTGPGNLTGTISAGPAYTQHELEPLEIEETVERLVILERIATPAAVVEIGVTAFPDPKDRRRTHELEAELIGRGTHYAVLAATDEVVQVSTDEESADWTIDIERGSRSGEQVSGAVTWPWTTKRFAPAHGATPWAELDDKDLLAVMTKRGRRFSMVDAEWANTLSGRVLWDPRPDMVRIESTGASLDAYTELLDAWLPVSAVGPITWVETDSLVGTDILRGLLAGQTTASTGPRIVLEVDGQGPGADLSTVPESLDQVHQVTLRVEAPPRMNIDWVMLLGSGNSTVAHWTLLTDKLTTRFDISMDVSTDSAWLVAVAGGDEEFAVTSPVWLKRP